MVALKKPIPVGITVEEFLAWAPPAGGARSWQLIDGEPMAMAPGRERHAAIMSEVSRLLGNHLLERAPACRVLTEPGIVPRIRSRQNYRVPDLGVTCAPPGNDMIVPDPVLLIEILSPSNTAETWNNIWAYTTIPSVQEIVAIHTVRIEAELLIRGPGAAWPETPDIIGPDGVLTLPSIGFSVPLRAVYRTTSLA